MSATPHLTPYDTGRRHEAKPWIPYGTTVTEATPAENFGKVDFDDEEGSTTAVVHLEITDEGRYQLHVTPLCETSELDVVIHTD